MTSTRLGHLRARAVVSLAVIFAWAAIGSTPAAADTTTITIVGSDTMRELTAAWIDRFTSIHPAIRFETLHDGSATAVPALADGEATLAAMSRAMSRHELDRARNGGRSDPVEVVVAFDALAVFVREDSPIRGLTMGQLDGIFSADQACGGPRIDRWDQLAIGAPAAKIELHGRNPLSGSYDIFKDRVLCGGAFSPELTEHADSLGVVYAVENNAAAIGYSGLGYDTPNVRPLAIGVGSAEDPRTRYYPYLVERYRDSDDVTKKFAWVVRGDYPLSRSLRFYFDGGQYGLPSPAEAFLRFALSDEGQAIVEEVGFVPLPPQRISEELKKLDR